MNFVNANLSAAIIEINISLMSLLNKTVFNCKFIILDIENNDLLNENENEKFDYIHI